MNKDRNATAAILVLRAFFAQFWLLQMIGKARDQESGITSLHNLSVWAGNVGTWMAKTTPLPLWSLKPFLAVLPFLELGLAALFVLGLGTRLALIGSALLITALDVGLMFQLKHDVVAMNLVIMMAALVGLGWEHGNRFAIDSLLRRRSINPRG